MLSTQAIQNNKLSQLKIVFQKAFHRMGRLWINDSLEIIGDKIQFKFECIAYFHYDTVIKSISYLKKTGVIDEDFILTNESLAQTSTDDILRFNIPIKCLKKIEISQDDLDFVFRTGIQYKNGLDVLKDEKEAARYYKLAADQGHVNAQYNLGISYENGQGVPKDEKEAAHYYKLAADQGHVHAQYYLGVLYKNGQGVPKDEKEAARYYKLAADQGSSYAQYNLGILYKNGEDVSKDEKEAARYYKLAADQGHVNAQYNLGILYEDGQGVPKDEKEAARYYKLAADQGHVRAQYYLGVLYKNGEGVSKDEKEAARYYKLAADQGHVRAQYYLGVLYENSRDVLPDDSQALHYIQLAANQGYSDALHNLSIRHRIGCGVPQDTKKANHFHQLATTVGNDDSFRQFTSSIESETSLIKAPSLLVKISEKTPTNISIRGLYEYIFSPNVDLSRSFVPWSAPLTRNQRGPTCGLNALEIGLTWCYPDRNVPPARKNPIKPTASEKEKNKRILSLRKIAKKHGSVIGEVFNINCLKNTAKEFNFNECKIIKMNKEDREKYTQQILNDIRTKRCSVVLPVDNDEGFPSNRQGKGAHYGLAWGYICIDNQYYFIVAHYGNNYLWPADALQKSHEQLPDTYPNGGEYYKDHIRDTYHPKEKDESVPENDLRRLPPSDLENFKFTALTIPTSSNAQAKNILVIDETKIDDESIYAAVKSGDSVTLKLLLEKGFLKSPEDHQKLKDIAEMRKNMFALQLLNDAKLSPTSLLNLAEKHENKKIDPHVCGSNDAYPLYFTPKPKAKEEWGNTLSKSTLKGYFNRK